MTPIQQAIEQVKEMIQEITDRQDSWDSSEVAMAKASKVKVLNTTLKHLQSLLPVEKEWAEKVWRNGWEADYDDAVSEEDFGGTFEQYYSQFKEVK